MLEFLKRMPDHIVIAIPSKGRLKEHVLEFLEAKGCSVKVPTDLRLQSHLEGLPNYHIVFMQPRDIAVMLGEGIVDVGFTGLDLIAETGVKVRPVIRLDKGKVKLAVMVPSNSLHFHPFHLLDKTIATPFPNIASAYFDRLKVRVTIKPILGASEGMPYLGIVDGIVDVIDTGCTAAQNGLKVIADDLFDSECVAAVNRPELQCNHQAINAFLRRIYS